MTDAQARRPAVTPAVTEFSAAAARRFDSELASGALALRIRASWASLQCLILSNQSVLNPG
jgi:hypothetical protein